MSGIRVALVCAMLSLLPAAAGAATGAGAGRWINEPAPRRICDRPSNSSVMALPFRTRRARIPVGRPNASAQRQLNEQGREQAKSIGESLRKLKIPVGRS